MAPSPSWRNILPENSLGESHLEVVEVLPRLLAFVLRQAGFGHHLSNAADHPTHLALEQLSLVVGCVDLLGRWVWFDFLASVVLARPKWASCPLAVFIVEEHRR